MRASTVETLVFMKGVLSIMRDKKVGVEPALSEFREIALTLGDFPGLREEFDIAADKFRATIAKARELVRLADQAGAEVGGPGCQCIVCRTYAP